MKKQTLHETAKLMAGLVLGDFLGLWYFSVAGLFPLSLGGIIWTQSVVVPGLIFDAALFLILIHYGWNVGKMPAVRERTYLAITGVIFAIVALLHLFRLFFGGFYLIVLGWSIPLWVSWIGVIVAAFLSYMSFRLRNHLK